jgi:hypothetical protein
LSATSIIGDVIRFVVVAALVMLAAGCGGSTQSGATTTSGKGAQLAFSHCMRSHGVPNFPDPDPNGEFPTFHTGVSKQASSAANDVCKHLLPSGGGGGANSQAGGLKFTFALKVARCMRLHGFPGYPDPSPSHGISFDGTGIDTRSPQFQTASTNCEKLERKALGLP